MEFAARDGEIPEMNLVQGRAVEVNASEHTATGFSLPPIKVHSMIEQAANVFVAVQHHGPWFYIDQVEQRSKETFGLLVYIYRMQVPQTPAQGPLLTG